MARKTASSSVTEIPPESYLIDIIRDDEWELFKMGMADDDFILNGWDMYGPEWVDHIPTSINAVTRYLFGIVMLRYQLGAYYCPIADVMIHGGRGCGKTDVLAIASATWTAFNPGHDWLHTAISKDQAKKSFDAIIRHGGWAADKRDFLGLFVVHTREAPFPDIEIRQWDGNDQGTRMWFRSMGKANEPVELLRSFEAGRVTADEAFRVQHSEGAVRVLAGCLRGPNHYEMAKHPELAQEYQDLAFHFSMTNDPDERDAILETMSSFGKKHGFEKKTKLLVYGNAGPHAWEWQRFEYGQRNPDKRYSVTWTSRDNPYFTEEQRLQLELQYADDPQALEVEMNATRPLPSGNVFTAGQIQSLFSPELDEYALKAIDPHSPRPGWIYTMHERYGLVHYMKPPAPGAAYVGAGDAGVQRVGVRGQWVVFVARTDQWDPKNPGPFEIVYYRVGNMTPGQQGSILPWLRELLFITEAYNIPIGHFAAEATGDQKNVHEVAWDSSVHEKQRMIVRPLNFSGQKRKFLMWTQILLTNGLLVSPTIRLLESEMASYEVQDLGLVQDHVMSLASLSAVIWPFVADVLDPALSQAWKKAADEEDNMWDQYAEFIGQLEQHYNIEPGRVEVRDSDWRRDGR